MKEWYQSNEQETLQQCQSTSNGLTQANVNERLERDGKNELEAEKQDGIFIIFLKQFLDLLVIVLIIASIISFSVGEKESAIVILVVITMNSILGTVQTVKAQKSLESLKQLSTPFTRVLRDGVIQEVKSDELVVGDIFYMEAGDVVSADGRVLESFNLQVNEASLTGEAESVNKHNEQIQEDGCPLGDQKNMVFSSGLVTYGRGRAVVTSTGMNTQIGKIAALMNQTKEKRTPLQRSLDDFSKKLSIGIIIICIIVFGLNMMRGGELLDSLMFAIALAVAAIPEALASIVTIVLSLSTQRMVKEHAIMKNINAVETLGCVSVICSDKTGTLTQNKMTLEDFYMNHHLESAKDIDVKNDNYRLAALIGALCSDATISNDQRIGDPTELAFIDLLDKFCLDESELRKKYARISELPFDSERKMMSTLQDIEGKRIMFVKGAPDELIRRCTKIYHEDHNPELDEEHKEDLLAQNYAFADKGKRVLALAYKEFSKDSLSLEDENDLVFVGLVSLMDPPREESKLAVNDCITAGIRAIMITGDHKVTARAIAKRIGIYQEGDMCIDGRELDAMSEEELNAKLKYISVYARVAPEHKIRIVDAWQKQGNNVAMTGDGVNDAPALKKADIGIAMGITGTEVSKDAASMILTDDNFSTIVKAVVTGRNVYNNIKNSIGYLLSGNFSGILAVLYCTLAALPLPFLPVHLLFINLMTDSLPAIAIGMEKANPYLLHEKPRKQNKSILDKAMIRRIGFEGFVIAVATIIAYTIGLNTSPAMATTFAFATLCMSRLFHGFNGRSSEPLFKIGLFSNKYSIGAFLIGYLLLNTILFIPALHSIFAIAAVSAQDILIINALAFAPTIVIQFVKWRNSNS